MIFLNKESMGLFFNKKGEESMKRRCFVEAVGTFMLTFTLAMTGHPMAVGLMFMAMIYFGGHISGGHFNPAISLAVFLRRKLSFHHLVSYIAAQTVGAFGAASLFSIMANNPLTFPAHPSFADCLVYETLPTFVLCAVALEVFMCTRFKISELAGLILGLTLVGISHFPGIFNPAIVIGVIVSSLISSAEASPVAPLLVHALCAFIGAALAAYLFAFVNNINNKNEEIYNK